MDQEEILRRMNELLDFHATSTASICQGGYKDDFFGLFMETYRNNYFETSSQPRLTGQAIKDIYNVRWESENKTKLRKKTKLLNALMNMWDEWYYALNKVGWDN